MDSTLRFLSNYVTNLTYDQLRQETIHQAKRRLIDSLGCAIAAHDAAPARIARDYALGVSGTPSATVLGTGYRSTADLAAFVNGVLIRYFDFNDRGLAQEACHPSDAIGGVLAGADSAGADGKALLLGITMAYEFQGRFGEVGRLWTRGWDHVIYEALGACAGAGKCMGLTPDQMANALSLTATPNIGLLQTRIATLSNWKGCAGGNACRNAVFACIMAQRGLTGPDEAFEGRYGFFNQVTGQIKLPPFGPKKLPFKVEDAVFKFYPVEHEAQVSVNPAAELYKSVKGRADEIEKVIIDAYDHATDVAADDPQKWDPMTRETADHSMPYVVAVALTRGDVTLGDFEMDKIRDPKILALMKKIEARPSPEYSKLWPEAYPISITVHMRSGEKHYAETRYHKGHPKNPMTDAEIESKYHRLADPVMGAAKATAALKKMWKLEDVKDISGLLAMFKL